MARLQLYGLAQSVYTRIVRLVLEEKSIDYKLVEADVFADNFDHQSHAKRHPFGRIPVLQHGEFNLYETGAICRYLDDTFPGISLQPVDAKARAVMNQVIGMLDSYAYIPMVWGVFVEAVINPLEDQPTDTAIVEDALKQSDVVLRELEKQVACNRNFLAGKSLSLADLHAVPMLVYFAKARAGETRLRSYPHLRAWLASMQSRPSLRATESIYE